MPITTQTGGNAAFIRGSQRRSSNEASVSVARKVAMVVELLRRRSLRFSEYEDVYKRDYRSFQRDLQQLRQIGVDAGFTISPIRDREVVRLATLDAKSKLLNRGSERIERLTATIARALGEPIVRELATAPTASLAGDDFFMLALPKLREGSSVAEIAATLREAQSSAAGRAAVRFRYADGGGNVKERDVEPYRVVLRSGMFYLIAFDRDRKGWRTFALDRMRSKPVKAGTCSTVRTLPATYASDDVIGFIKTNDKRVDVTIELSPKVVASATARTWQADQRIERLSGGRAQMTFSVNDVGEVVRWALGFGPDARIVAPPHAVELARAMVAEIVRTYA